MTVAPMSNQQRAMMAAQQNMAARNLVLGTSVGMFQQIFSQASITPSSTPTLNIVPRNVGLIKRFIVVVSGTVTNANATTSTTLTLTPWGPANLFSQIVFSDLSNYVRIQTTGWHLAALNAYRHGYPFGAARTNTTYPVAYGNIMGTNLMAASTAIAGNSGTGTFNYTYEIPLAYSDSDLRGAVFAAVTNSTMQLQLTFNPTPIALSTADPTLAVWQHSTATLSGSAISAVTVTVYQEYLDQLPGRPDGSGPILPLQDLSIMYLLQSTNFTGATVNQDFPMPYANFRDFLSTTLMYDNNASGVGPLAGTDIGYLALQAANLTYFYKSDPYTHSLRTRNEINDDMPKGVYYFNHRARPLNTIQFGNLQLILNASTVNTNATAYVGYEMMGVANTILGAQALPGG